MTKRRPLLLGLVLLACLGAGFVGYLWATAPRLRINQESFERIRAGMTLQEVEGILNAPSGDYGPGENFHSIALEASSAPLHWEFWTKGHIVILVRFHEERVHDKYIYVARRRMNSLFDRIRAWIELAW